MCITFPEPQEVGILEVALSMPEQNSVVQSYLNVCRATSYSTSNYLTKVAFFAKQFNFYV